MSMWRRPVDKLAGVTAPALFPPALAAYIRDTLAPAPKVAPPPRVGILHRGSQHTRTRNARFETALVIAPRI
jgi:hypothetical protein